MNTALTNLRALAIILIVLGHSIIIYDPAYTLMSSTNEVPFLVTLKHGINFIQLKLFFALSGYCLAYTLQRSNFFSFIKKKSYRLLLPYLIFTIFWMDPIKYILHVDGYGTIKELLPQLWGNNSGHLWYLITLFGVMVISYPFLKRGSLLSYSLFTVLAIALYSYSRKFTHVLQLNNVACYLIFFGGGVLVKCYKNTYLAVSENLCSNYCMFDFRLDNR